MNNAGHEQMSDSSQARTRARDLSGPGATSSFWEAVAPPGEPLRSRAFVLVVVGFVVLSVPWYLPSELAARTIGGLPLWTWIAFLCSVGLSATTAAAALFLWRDDGDARSAAEASASDGTASSTEQER